MQHVLVTGAAGDVGTRLRKLMPGLYPHIRWSDIRTPADLTPGDEFMPADLVDYTQVETIVAGIEGIVHLGGYSTNGPWPAIHDANIIGCYNLFEAARRAGVKRLVFASSNHAVGFYPREQKIGVDVTVRPDSYYGVSKAFGEALGSLYSEKHGLRVTCLRIGNVADAPIDKRRLSIWLDPRDLLQLIRIGLEHPDIRFEIFYGMSDNTDAWWDNANATRFGYRPQHRARDFIEQAMTAEAKLPPDSIGDRYQGGTYCSDGYDALLLREAD